MLQDPYPGLFAVARLPDGTAVPGMIVLRKTSDPNDATIVGFDSVCYTVKTSQLEVPPAGSFVDRWCCQINGTPDYPNVPDDGQGDLAGARAGGAHE